MTVARNHAAGLRTGSRVNGPTPRRGRTGVRNRSSETPIEIQSIRQHNSRAILNIAESGSGPFFNLHRCSKNYTQRLMRLCSLKDEPAAYEEAVGEIFESYASRVIAACRTVHKRGRESDARHAEAIEELARSMNLTDRAVPESVEFDDTSGKTRTICAYGLKDAARQTLLKDIIISSGLTSASDYAMSGQGGRDGLVRNVLDAIARGERHFITTDIANAFASVRPQHVTRLLALPTGALVNILFAGHESRVLHDCTHTMHENTEALCGLPHGSACSSSALSMVVGSVLRPLAGDMRELIHFVDDFVGSARSRSELERLHGDLEEGFHNVGCGGLGLAGTRLIDFELGEPIDSVGYRIQKTRLGIIVVEPSPKAWVKAERRCFDRLSSAYDRGRGVSSDALMELAIEYMKHWAASCASWTLPLKRKLEVAEERAVDFWIDFCSAHGIDCDA